MGYTTDFSGEFAIEPALTAAQVAYLTKFNETRRMARDASLAEALPDPVRLAVGLPLGYEGAYFVGGSGLAGQGDDPSILCHNTPPGGERNKYSQTTPLVPAVLDCQPGLWCQWVPSEDGTTLAWDEGEKFYNYTEWLQYIVTHFLIPWGRTLNGEVQWRGEDSDDRGTIYAVNNEVTAVEDVITNPGPPAKTLNEPAMNQAY